MNLEEIKATLLDLGKRNDTLELSRSLIEYIERNQAEFQNDYSHTCKEQRFSSGKVEKQVFLKLADICKRQNGNGNAAQASRVMILLGYDSYRINPQRFRQKIENLKKMEKAKKKSHRDSRRSSQVRTRKARKDSESSEFQNSSNEEEDGAGYRREVIIQAPQPLLPLPPKIAPPPPSDQNPVDQSNEDMLPPLASLSQTISQYFSIPNGSSLNSSSEMDIMYDDRLMESRSEQHFGRQNSSIITNDLFATSDVDYPLCATDSVSMCNFNVRDVEYDASFVDGLFCQQQQLIYNNKSTQPIPDNESNDIEGDFQVILDLFSLDDSYDEFGERDM